MLAEVRSFHKWLRWKSPQTTTAVHYLSDVRLFFHWVDKAPQAVTLHDVDRYIEQCQQRGHAIATVNRRLAAVRSFYHFLAVERETAPANPVLPRRHFIRQGRRLPRDVEDSQLERLFAVITEPRDRAMFGLMLRCGLRVGEVRGLSLSDLYLHQSPNSLPRLWVRGKNGSQRVVYLSAQALSLLEAWLVARPDSPDTALFLNRFGRRLSVTGIQDRLAGYCRQADLWLTCHQLRHTFGRHLVEAGVPPTTIQRLLGHARLRTSELYMHISDQQVQTDYQTAMLHLSQRLALGQEPTDG
jgi:site-specific recombinase XerD